MNNSSNEKEHPEGIHYNLTPSTMQTHGLTMTLCQENKLLS